MGGSDARELGSHAQGAPCVVAEALGSSDSHAAPAEVQIEKLIDLGLILEQYILAGYADICGTALDVDGDVAGLDPEVSHADFAVLKDQLAVVLADRRTREARRLEHRVDLLPQPALGQSDVEHCILRYVGLGCLSVHALEHIEIYSKADRLGAALHAVHELVVPAAREGAVGHSVDEALENNAVIISAVADDREIYPYIIMKFPERRGGKSIFELLCSLSTAEVAADLKEPRHRHIGRAGERDQGYEVVGVEHVDAVLFTNRDDTVHVLLAHALYKLLLQVATVGDT